MMKKNIKDSNYLEIVNHILNDYTFSKLNGFPHHGTTRLKHLLRVSYYSYKIAKMLNLDYKSSAISGLLHDFYIGEEDKKEYWKFQRIHPMIASENSTNHFKVSLKEKNIIETHMFPFTKPSRYIEGWIVSFVDKTIGAYEYGVYFKNIVYVKSKFFIKRLKTIR